MSTIKTKTKKINKYGNIEWVTESQYDHTSRSISFNWNCDNNKIIYGQMLFVNSKCSGGFVDSSNRIMVTRHNTAKEELNTIKLLCEHWAQIHSNKPLWNWSRGDLSEFIRSGMVSPSDRKKLYSRKRLTQICKILSMTRSGYTQGYLPDGIQFSITDSFRRAIMDPLLEERGLSYEEWSKDGSYGSVPLTIASLLIADAITLIESEEAKAAAIFFSVWRRSNVHPSNCFWKQSGSKLDRLERYFKYVGTNKLTDVDSDFGESFLKNGLGHLQKLPWKSVGQLSLFCKDLMQACLTILLLLSGFRISEIISLRFSDYYKFNDEWYFVSSVPKTHEGMRVPRVLHDLTAKAAQCLEDISYIDPRKYSIGFFHRGFMEGAANAALNGKFASEEWARNIKGFSIKTVYPWFNLFYKKYILKKHPDCQAVCKKVSPHQCRHTWAEFSLRRIDGNVEERIREHFLHSKHSRMTRKYTQHKLKESVQYFLENEYLYEVVKRISCQKIDDRFVGPAARRILKLVGDVKTLTPDEFNSEIESCAAQIGRFAAFEWGFCAFFHGSEGSAQCLDPVTFLPNIDGCSGPNICIKCPNGLNNDIQAKHLVRTGIQHHYIATHHPIKAIGKLSADIMEAIVKRLEDDTWISQ